ncbi:MAG: L,D-transpeptidase [Hyphomicrobiaceae bacterium]|nr:L,D-transpeptidase [Hyphomicrobiaceae bacterium]
MMRQDRYARPSEYRARRYGRWYDNEYDDEPRYRSRRYRDQWQDTEDDDDEPRASTSKNKQQADSDEVRSGGPRPSIAAKAPPRVALASDFAPGSIVIDQSARKLYYIVSRSLAYRYPISVGREGFSWTGKEKVSRIADWPDWHPPEEMRERDPKLPVKMTGGLNNPLGAKAIYLGNTLYRIHGTNNPKSIGQAASSGCFRMLNEHVLHLAGQVQVGAQVHVMKHLPKTVATAN